MKIRIGDRVSKEAKRINSTATQIEGTMIHETIQIFGTVLNRHRDHVTVRWDHNNKLEARTIRGLRKVSS